MIAPTVAHVRCTAAVALAAAAGCGVCLLQRRRHLRNNLQELRKDCDGSADFKWLSRQVAHTSRGRLVLVDTHDRGRCLAAAQSLPAGYSIRDMPVVPHGSDRGTRFSAALAVEHGAGAETLVSSDLAAALDFVASLTGALAAAGESGDNSSDAIVDDSNSKDVAALPLRALWALYAFDGEAKPVPMIRKWHTRWREPLAAVPPEDVEAAWRHVVPNWRRLTVASPRGMCYEDARGKPQLMLGHDVVCGLWLLMALCEHSCDPSCALVHDGSDLWFTVLRPLCAGEAVTTSYLNLEELDQPFKKRRDHLHERWGFVCSCARCCAEAAAEICLPHHDHAALFKHCQTPPNLADDAALEAFCGGVRKLRGLAATRLRGGFAEPTAQALVMLEALFLPDDDVCRELLTAAAPGDGREDAGFGWEFARALLRDAEALAQRVTAEGRSDAASAGLELSPPDAGQSARSLLRVLYRRHLVSRPWPRRRVQSAASGGHYVASAAAAVARSAARVGAVSASD